MAHALTYTVQDTTEHLCGPSHALDRARVEQLLSDWGVAVFFSTCTEVHRWLHEIEWYRGEVPLSKDAQDVE